VQFVAQRFVAEKRTAIFGRENGVNQDFGERLWHDDMMGRTPIDSTLSEFMMDNRLPSVAVSRQHWAA
jgi:hypothetical protein